MAIYQAYIPRKEPETSASDEDRLRKEDLIHDPESCKIHQLSASELMEKQLQLIPEMQILLSELNGTKDWTCEKANAMRCLEYKDEDIAIYCLTKHQTSEERIDIYNDIIKETGCRTYKEKTCCRRSTS